MMDAARGSSWFGIGTRLDAQGGVEAKQARLWTNEQHEQENI